MFPTALHRPGGVAARGENRVPGPGVDIFLLSRRPDSEGGAQPMTSSRGDLAVLLNGEIYNFQEIREKLRREGRAFHTDTDTEVLP